MQGKFLKRQQAYRDLFLQGNVPRGTYFKRIWYCLFWFGKKRDYQKLFNSIDPSAQRVLADLIRFSNYHGSTFDKDSNMQSYKSGMRDVVARIVGFTNFTDDELRRFTEE